ncbi:hypothetical protein B0H12DRAFT_1240506 [Mycena haematopus]|nr:hypothetical protein B0H12DRAFT_1240506 [Mycena haematopus]
MTEATQFKSPPPPATDYPAKSPEQFFAETSSRPPFSAVLCEDVTWVATLDAIILKIHHRQHPTESFRIKPPPPGEDTAELKKEQEKVDAYLVRLLRDVMTLGRLREYLRNQDSPFNLNWDTFYEELNERLQLEGHCRYTSWVSTRLRRRDAKRSRPKSRALVPRSNPDDEELLEMLREKEKVDY